MIDLSEIAKAFSGFLIPLIACLTAYIAYQQYKTNKFQLKLALYDRRLKIYKEFIQILSLAMKDGRLANHQLILFKSNTAESYFLFDTKINDHIEEIYKKGLKLALATTELYETNDLPKDERKRIAGEISENLKWCGEQFAVAKDNFLGYLSLHG